MTADNFQGKSEEAFRFPCPYPLKIIGRAGELFIPTILNLLEGTVGPIAKDAVVSRLSREGRYLSLTVTIMARDREQLETVYRLLSAHKDVVLVL